MFEYKYVLGFIAIQALFILDSVITYFRVKSTGYLANDPSTYSAILFILFQIIEFPVIQVAFSAREKYVNSLESYITKYMITKILKKDSIEDKETIINNINRVKSSIINTLHILFPMLSNIISIIVFATQVPLAVLVFLVILSVLTSCLFDSKKKDKMNEKYSELENKEITKITDLINNHFVIKSLSSVEKQVNEKLQPILNEKVSVLSWINNYYLSVDISNHLVYGFSLIFYMITTTNPKLNELLVVFNSIRLFKEKLEEFVSKFRSIKTAYTKIEKTLQLIDFSDIRGKKVEVEKVKKVRFENVSYLDVFENVNLEFDLSQKTLLKGISGSGKSTLLKLIIGMIKPTTGKIYFDDNDSSMYTINQIATIFGYCPQLNELTVLETENVEENIFLSDKSCFRHEFVNEKWESAKLSGGQKQRVAISRILNSNPQVLILDEYNNGLDKENIKLVDEVIKDYARIEISHIEKDEGKYDKVIEIRKN